MQFRCIVIRKYLSIHLDSDINFTNNLDLNKDWKYHRSLSLLQEIVARDISLEHSPSNIWIFKTCDLEILLTFREEFSIDSNHTGQCTLSQNYKYVSKDIFI